MPCDGRDTPDSRAAGTRPQTLKSVRRSLKGEVANSTLDAAGARRPRTCRAPRRCSRRRPAAGPPSSPDRRCARCAMTGPGFGSGGAVLTNMFAGSTVVVHTSRHVVAGAALADAHRDRRGGRRESHRLVKRPRRLSWPLRWSTHSSKMEPKPAEKRTRFDAASRTSNAVGAVSERILDGARGPGPRRRFDHHLVEGEQLLRAVAGVEVVHAHGAGRRGRSLPGQRRQGDQGEGDHLEERAHAPHASAGGRDSAARGPC